MCGVAVAVKACCQPARNGSAWQASYVGVCVVAAGAGCSVPDGVGVAVAAIVGAQDAGNEHNRGLRAVEGDALKNVVWDVTSNRNDTGSSFLDTFVFDNSGLAIVCFPGHSGAKL